MEENENTLLMKTCILEGNFTKYTEYNLALKINSDCYKIKVCIKSKTGLAEFSDRASSRAVEDTKNLHAPSKSYFFFFLILLWLFPNRNKNYLSKG